MSPFHTLNIQLRADLKDGLIEFAVGGFDISFNEHETRSFATHWKPHAWLFVPTAQLLWGYQRLRAHFPRDKSTVPFPFKTYLWDGNPSAIAYALKGEFQRRTTLASVASHGLRRRRNVRYRALRSKQKVELLIALDRIGLHGRLFLKGAKAVEVDGEVKIRRANEIQPLGKCRHREGAEYRLGERQ